jgi:thiol:disulfide interchange protein DsbA
MKRRISIFTLVLLALAVAACSKEDTAPVEESQAVETEAPEAEAQTTQSTVATTESLEVVEESAAEAEPEDQAIVLARADDPAAGRIWKFKEGQHYNRFPSTAGRWGSADKIEVIEVFMYSCPHCYDLESFINTWVENKDPNIRFVRIPAIFNQLAALHAQLYYTEVFLAQAGKLKDPAAFRNMVFEEYHRRGNRLTSETAIQRLFARSGISEDDFKRTWSSFEVDQALRRAREMAINYGVASVPMIVVNGKYTTDAGSAGSYPKLIELIDELTVREGLR